MKREKQQPFATTYRAPELRLVHRDVDCVQQTSRCVMLTLFAQRDAVQHCQQQQYVHSSRVYNQQERFDIPVSENKAPFSGERQSAHAALSKRDVEADS